MRSPAQLGCRAHLCMADMQGFMKNRSIRAGGFGWTWAKREQPDVRLDALSAAGSGRERYVALWPPGRLLVGHVRGDLILDRLQWRRVCGAAPAAQPHDRLAAEAGLARRRPTRRSNNRPAPIVWPIRRGRVRGCDGTVAKAAWRPVALTLASRFSETSTGATGYRSHRNRSRCP